LFNETWNQQLALALFSSRIATVSLGVMGVMGAMPSITGIFGMAAYSVSNRRELGIPMAPGVQRKAFRVARNAGLAPASRTERSKIQAIQANFWP
jgi:hypothetical protein